MTARVFSAPTRPPGVPGPGAVTRGAAFLRYGPWVLLPGLALLLYANTFNHPWFVDDHTILGEHPQVLGEGSAWDVWTTDYWAGLSWDTNLYRPVTILSFRTTMAVNPEPGFQRLVNVLLLGGIGLLAWRWLLAWVPPAVAAGAGVLFVAHPGHVEVINHTVGRADLLALLGIMGWLVAHQHSDRAGRWNTWTVTAAVIATAVALGSKEFGAALFPAALVQVWVLGDGAETSETPPRVWPWRRWAVALGTLVVPGVLYALGRLSVVGAEIAYDPTVNDFTGNPLRGLGIVERLPGAFVVIGTYARLVFWPSTVYIHQPPTAPGWGQAAVWLGLMVAVSVGVGLVAAVRRRHRVAVWAALSIGHLAVVSNLLVSTGVFAANRLAGPLVLSAVLAAALGVAAGLRRGWLPVRPVAALASAGGVLFGVTVWDANHRWSGELAKMEADAAARPDDFVTRYWRASMLSEAGRPQEAEPELRALLELEPHSNELTHQYVAVLHKLGRTQQAVAQLQRLGASGHAGPLVLGDLGLLALMAGDLEQAERWLDRAEAAGPSLQNVAYARALWLWESGRTDEALRRMAHLVEAFPRFEEGRLQYEQMREAVRAPGSDPLR